jgi:hypothetical protein
MFSFCFATLADMASISTLLGLAAAALGPNDFTISMPVRPETPEGQRLIAVRAREICGARFPLLGRRHVSRLERDGPQGSWQIGFEVRQELTCSDPPPAPVPATLAPKLTARPGQS